MLKKLKSINYRHWICLALILTSLALGLFVYRYPYVRLIEGGRDLGQSIANFFCTKVLGAEEAPFTFSVNEYSSIDLREVIGFDLELFADKLTGVWSEIFVGEHFMMYLLFLIYNLLMFTLVVTVVIAVVILFALPIIATWDNVNNDYGEETRPLQIFKRLVAAPFRQALQWWSEFWSFFRTSPWWRIFLVIWLFHFGLFAVLLEFFACYFYFLAMLDLTNIGFQLLKLLADLLLMFNTLPALCWIIIGVLLFDAWRVRHGTDKLYHLDARNKGLLKELPMYLFISAPPRTGKGVLGTDMALTFSAIDRDNAYDIMNERMSMFPRFPWIAFELELQERITTRQIKHWASARAWISGRSLQYACNPRPEYIWNYDTELYPIKYNDGIAVHTIWQVLEEYAQAYFLYAMDSSAINSNYPVREDYLVLDAGNLPVVNTDYLERDPEIPYTYSTYSKIIQFDAHRLGVKMDEDNPCIGGFEFGIGIVSEIDKEYKNNLQLSETKFKDTRCNQKNDLFNQWLKMAGHNAMLANKCFLHFIFDAQRPSSWGADARELTTVLHIEKHREECNALPFYWIEEGLIARYRAWWKGVKQNSRFKWGNSRLLTWLGDGLDAILKRYIDRRRLRFGYYQQDILCESGTLEKENLQERKYFVIFRKTYANRFASDYFRSFSEEQTARCQIGMIDFPTYRERYASVKEVIMQGGHFGQELIKYHNLRKKDE